MVLPLAGQELHLILVYAAVRVDFLWSQKLEYDHLIEFSQDSRSSQMRILIPLVGKQNKVNLLNK